MENKDKLCKICKKNKRGFPSVQLCSGCRRKKNIEFENRMNILRAKTRKLKYQSLTIRQRRAMRKKWKDYQREYHKNYYRKKKEVDSA